MANKTKRPFKPGQSPGAGGVVAKPRFRTGQLVRLKEDHQSGGFIRGSLDRIRLILKIRDVKQTYGGIVNHYRKYTFLNPEGTTGWEKWDAYEEEMYEVVSDEV